MENGDVVEELSVGQSRGFLFDEYHSTRVIKQGDDFRFYLDEAKMVSVRFSFDEATPGSYKLYAWVISDEAEGEILVQVRNRDSISRTSSSSSWEKITIRFDVDEPNSVVNISAAANFDAGEDGHVAMADFYLVKTPE